MTFEGTGSQRVKNRGRYSLLAVLHHPTLLCWSIGLVFIWKETEKVVWQMKETSAYAAYFTSPNTRPIVAWIWRQCRSPVSESDWNGQTQSVRQSDSGLVGHTGALRPWHVNSGTAQCTRRDTNHSAEAKAESKCRPSVSNFSGTHRDAFTVVRSSLRVQETARLYKRLIDRPMGDTRSNTEMSVNKDQTVAK